MNVDHVTKVKIVPLGTYRGSTKHARKNVPLAYLCRPKILFIGGRFDFRTFLRETLRILLYSSAVKTMLPQRSQRIRKGSRRTNSELNMNLSLLIVIPLLTGTICALFFSISWNRRNEKLIQHCTF